jgi:hypothetical protein
MTDAAYEQIMAMRKLPNCPNMFDIPAVFELALAMNYDDLADFIFMHTERYSAFILTGERD